MKTFLSKTVILGLIPVFMFIAFCFIADEKTDAFYIRFTTPQQQNLILGTSRAAQGIIPKIIQDSTGIIFSNYAFTVAHSPFGAVYYNSIIKKHNKKENSVFIVAVDPWSISTWTETPDDTTTFRENNLCVGTTHFVNINPNFEYLFENFKGKYSHILSPPIQSLFLHKDGWLESFIPEKDSSQLELSIKEKAKTYREENLPKSRYSQYRFNYLLKTISYLNKYGEVYLVRLPIHNEIMKIENILMPNFDQMIQKAIDNCSGYLDLTIDNDNFIYTDGNHLYKSSAMDVSSIISHWINLKRSMK